MDERENITRRKALWKIGAFLAGAAVLGGGILIANQNARHEPTPLIEPTPTPEPTPSPRPPETPPIVKEIITQQLSGQGILKQISGQIFVSNPGYLISLAMITLFFVALIYKKFHPQQVTKF